MNLYTVGIKFQKEHKLYMRVINENRAEGFWTPNLEVRR